jgi:hypothetical protein
MLEIDNALNFNNLTIAQIIGSKSKKLTKI